MTYFVFDGENYEEFGTADAAKEAAEESIDNWRDFCDPGWPPEVANVAWGKVIESAREKELEDEDQHGNPYVDYSLEPVSEEPTQ